MVMDLLGPSLEETCQNQVLLSGGKERGKERQPQKMLLHLQDLFSSCQRKFSVKSLMQLADQMITRLEYLHSKDFFGWSSDLVETKCLSFALLCPHCFASFAGWFKLRGLHPPGFETRQLHDWIGQRFQLGSLIIKWKSYRSP